MNFQQKLNTALVDGFRVREVPIGYVIVSPFRWFDDDPLAIYARIDQGRIRFEDAGDTLLRLEDGGPALSESRLQTLRELAADHQVVFDEDDHAFHSQWVEMDRVEAPIFPFLSFMNRLQDISMLSRERVEMTFRDDLVDALRRHFEGRAKVEERAPIVPGWEEYITDLLVISNSGSTAAVYAATGEAKALEALLSAELIQREKIPVTPILVYNDLISSPVSKRTRSRTVNSETLKLADWSGGHRETIAKVEASLQ